MPSRREAASLLPPVACSASRIARFQFGDGLRQRLHAGRRARCGRCCRLGLAAQATAH